MSGEDVTVGRGKFEVYPDISDSAMARFRSQSNKEFEIAGVAAGKAYALGFNRAAGQGINLSAAKAALKNLEKEFSSFYSRVDPSKNIKPMKVPTPPNFTAEMQRIISLNEKMHTATQKAAQANQNLSGAMHGAAAGATAAGNASNQAAAAHGRAASGANRASSSYRNMGGAASALSQSHIPLISQLGFISTEFTKMASRVSYNAFQLQLLGQNITRYVTLPLTIASGALTAFGLKASMDVEDATASLKALLPVGTNVKKVISQIQDIAVKSPIFKFTDLLRDIQQLIGAGLDINKALAFEKAFSRIGTTLALTPEQTQSAQVAIVQMLNKGKVYAEELVQQLAEHVPGAIKMLADYFHVTQGELLALVKKGKLTGEQVVKAFTDIGNSKKFIEGATNASHTLRNSWQQLKESITVSLSIAFIPLRDKLKELIVTYGPGLNKTLKDIGTSISDYVVTNIDHWIDSIVRLQQSFSPETWATMGKTILSLAVAGPGLLITSKALQSIGAAFAALALVIDPAGALLVGAALVAVGFVGLYATSEQLRRQISQLWEDLTNIFHAHGIDNRIAGFFKDIKEAAKDTQDFIIGNFVPAIRALFLGEGFLTQTTKNASGQITYPFGNPGVNSTQRQQTPLGSLRVPRSVERQQTPYALVPGNQDIQPNRTLIDGLKEIHDAFAEVKDKVNDCYEAVKKFFDKIDYFHTIGDNFSASIRNLSDAFDQLGIHIKGSNALMIIFGIVLSPWILLFAGIAAVVYGVSDSFRLFTWLLANYTIPILKLFAGYISNIVWPWLKVLYFVLMGDYPKAWHTFWGEFGAPFVNFWKRIGGDIRSAWMFIKIIGEEIVGFFTWIWDMLWGHSPLRDMYLFFSEWLPSAVWVTWRIITGIWDAILGFLTSVWNGLYDRFFGPVWYQLSVVIPGALDGLWKWFSTVFHNTLNFLTDIFNRLYREFFLPLWNQIANVIPGAFDGMWHFIERIWGTMSQGLKAGADWLYNHFFLPIWNQLANIIPGAFQGMANAASSWVSKMGEWVVNGFNWILDKMEQFLGKFNNIKNALHLPIPDVHVGGLIGGGAPPASGGGASSGGGIFPFFRRAAGGLAGLREGVQHGPGNGTSDSIVAVANNEYVVNAKKAKQWLPVLNAINFGRGYASGGLTSDGIPRFSFGGFLASTLGAAAHAVENLTKEAFDWLTDPGHVIGSAFDTLMNSAGRPAGYIGDFGVGVARHTVEAFGRWFTENIAAKFSQGDFEGAKAWAKAQAGKPYTFGAVGPNTYDCSGSQGNVWAILTGHPLYQRYFTTTSDFRSLGFDPGEDPAGYSIYVNPFPGSSGHMMGSIQGHLFEFGDPGHYDSGTSNPHSFAQAFHLVRGIAAAGSSWTGGSSGGSWSGVILEALARTGHPASWLGPIAAKLMQESGGNPRAINLTDINAQLGHPSLGLMQVIDPTFRAYHQAGTSNDIYDPLANLSAAINYIAARYGTAFALPSGGYDGGGLLPPGFSSVWNGTGGYEHVVTAPKASYLMDAVASTPVVNVYIGNEKLDEHTDYRIQLAQDELARELNAA